MVTVYGFQSPSKNSVTLCKFCPTHSINPSNLRSIIRLSNAAIVNNLQYVADRVLH